MSTYDSQRIVLNLTTNADLSSYIYRGVQILASDTCAAISSGTAGTKMGGILEYVSAATTGADARVCVFGSTKGIAGAAMSQGSDFCFSVNNTGPGYIWEASSQAAWSKTGTTYVNGQTLETAVAASQVIKVFLNYRQIILG